MAKVFISYSRKDIEFAKRLTAELQKSDLDFWIDWEGIPPTVDWWKEIERGIEEADIFLFLISPDSARSRICGQEVEHAVKNGKRLIPLIVRDVNADDAPPQIRHLNWVFIRESDDFASAIQKLLKAIHTDYDWVQAHRRLQVKALEWERNNKENSYLLRGRDLQDAEAQLRVNGEKEPHPTSLQREYIEQSSRFEFEEKERQQQKEQQIELEQRLGIRLRRLTYILIAVFTAAFIVLFLWLNAAAGDLAVNSVTNQMLAIAETSASFIDGDRFELLVASYEEEDDAVLQDEFYLWLEYIVKRIVATNENIDGDMGVYFVAAADAENKVLAIYSDFDNFKAVWDMKVDSVMLSGMKETRANTEVYDDDYGTWVSACTPILNSEETSVGALCVDLDASVVAETRQKATSTLLIAFIAIYPAMILGVFLTTRSISRQRSTRR